MVDPKCRIVLDVQDAIARVRVNVKTGDVGRKLYIALVDGGVPYAIDADGYVAMTARKPNGNVLYDERCTVELGDVIVYEIDGAVNELEGRVPCEVKVYGEDGSVSTSARFDMIVRDAIYEDGDEVEVPMGKTRVLLSPEEAQVGEYLEIEEVDDNGRVTKLKSVPAPSGSGGSCGCSITVARKGSEDDPVSLSGYGIGAGDVVRFQEGDYYVEPFDMEGLDHVTFLLGDARIHCAGDHFLEATRCDDLQIIGGTVMGGNGTVMGIQIKDCLRPVLRQVCFNGIGSATLEDTKGLTILGDCTGFLVDRCVVDGVSAGVVSSDGWLHAYGILVNRLGSTNAYSRKGQILHCRIANVAGIDTDTVKADGDGIFVQRPPYLDDSGKVAGIDQVIDIDGCVFENCKKRGVKSAAWGTTVRDCVFDGEFYYAAVDLQYGHGTVDRCRIYNASNYTGSVTSGVVANDGGFTVRDCYINCLYVNEDGTNGRHPGVRMDKRQPGSIFDKTVPWDPILVERCYFDQINYGVYASTSVSGVDTYRLTALEVLDCRWGTFYHGHGVFISSTVFDEVDVARFVDFRFDAGDTSAEVKAVNSNFSLPIMLGADPTKAYEIHSRYWLDKVVTYSNTPTAAHTRIVSVGEGCRKEYTAYGSRIWGSGDPNGKVSGDPEYALLRGSKVGDEYTDTATGKKYTCTAAGGVGVWTEMGSQKVELPESEVGAVYVATDGDDSASGGRDDPLKTINKAIATGAKTILVMAGRYKETVYLSDPGRELEIIAKPLSYTDKDVIIDLGRELQFTADSSTGLVKAIVFSSVETFMDRAFVSQTEQLIYADSFISDGYACNLWFGDTKLVPVLSLAECQATEGTWFYDGSFIYANGESGTYTLSDGEAEYGLYFAGLGRVKLMGITVKHARKDAVRLMSCSDAEVSRCVFGYSGLYNGLALENTSAVVRDCEAMFNRTDGLNIHGVGTADFIDCVSHDNGDDGISHHDRSDGMIIGGEYYNNIKGGVCSPTFGSRNTVNGVYIHDNGTGVYAVTSEDGVYPECTVSNCLIKGNDVGVQASRYTLRCWGNVISGNGQDTATDNGGVIDRWDTDRSLSVPGRPADADAVGKLFLSQKRRFSGYLKTNSYISINSTARTITFGDNSFVTWGAEKVGVSNKTYTLAEDLKWGGYLYYDPVGDTFVKTYADGYILVGALWWPFWRHELHAEPDKVLVDGMPVMYTSRYLDKKACCLGDSMTDTAITSDPYCKWLPQLLGFHKDKVVNCGVGGSSIAPKVDTIPTWDTVSSFLDRYGDMDSDADVVIVFGGVNDWMTGRSLGAVTDTGTDTFFGAMKALCEGLIQKYPTGDIYVFSSPQNDYVHRPATDLTGTDWAENEEGYNRKGHKLSDYVEAMAQVCGMYGIPFCDMTKGLWWGLSGVLGEYKGNEDGSHKAGLYGADSLHPNAEGHKKIALKMAGFIHSC